MQNRATGARLVGRERVKQPSSALDVCPTAASLELGGSYQHYGLGSCQHDRAMTDYQTEVNQMPTFHAASRVELR
jgi:hypothetical protein